jgi:hypothetical protein
MANNYVFRYLFDDNIGTSAVNAEGGGGGTTLTQTGDGSDVTWGQENNNDYPGESSNSYSPYKKGETGNPSPGKYCLIMPSDSTSKRMVAENVLNQNYDNWTLQFWFKANNNSFDVALENEQVLLAATTSGQSLPDSNSNAGIQVIAYDHDSSGSINSVKFMKGNGTVDPAKTYTVEVHDCIGSRNNNDWYFVCITFTKTEGMGPDTKGTVIVRVGYNNGNGISAGFPSLLTETATTVWQPDMGSGGKLLLGYCGLGSTNEYDGAYYVLRYFNYVLSDTQINYLYRKNALDNSTYGDVHVMPRLGKPYSFHTPGFYRYFDDNSGFIINVQTEICKQNRWTGNDYITHVYIQTDKGNMLCKSGFRGEKVQILENSGLDYELADISADKTALMYCSDCRYSTTNDDYRKRHIHKTGHNIKSLERNKLIVKIDTNDNSYVFTVTNVDRYNLQPSCVNLNMTHEEYANRYSGFMIHQKYSTLMLESLKDDMLMKADNDTDNEIEDDVEKTMITVH